MIEPDESVLKDLEREVRRALHSGDDSRLRVLGYGEISLVVGWPTDEPRMAAKRLPVFDDRERARAYGAVIEDYLEALTTRGVTPVETDCSVIPTGDGRWALYVLQPILEADWLGPAVLSTAGADRGEALLDSIVETIADAVDDRLGVDGQLSNWADTPDGLRYLDVTTPFLTDEHGTGRLDLEILNSPLPGPLRPIVGRFVAPGIVQRYHRPRDVLLDLAANLLKEGLEPWVDRAIRAAGRRLDEPLEREEVERYYRSDARLWELMLRLRRADRWWHRTVRRRPYPTLLPGPIER